MSEKHESTPYVDLVKQNALMLDETLRRVRGVLEHGQFILGPEVEELEATLASQIGVPHVIGVNSGTDALLLALRAHRIGPGDEVILPSHTFVATAAAVCLVGATPVFADIDPETMLLSPTCAAEKVGPRTRAIVPVHLNGYPCDMDGIQAVADAHDLLVLEDAAQALGARRGDRSTGTWGTGCFSLHPLKVLGACGDAGFITTADDDFALRLRQLRNIGLQNREEAISIAGNSRLDTIQAAILLAKIPFLDRWIEARNAHASAYRSALAGTLRLPPTEPSVRCVYSAFVVRPDDVRRDRLRKALSKRGVDAKVHYPIPVHRQKPYAEFADGPLPVTDEVAASILSLPCTPELESDQRNRIIATILDELD